MALIMDAAIVRDRETGKEYAIHNACESAFYDTVRALGIDPLARFAPMGPTVVDAGERCNYGACAGGEE